MIPRTVEGKVLGDVRTQVDFLVAGIVLRPAMYVGSSDLGIVVECYLSTLIDIREQLKGRDPPEFVTWCRHRYPKDCVGALVYGPAAFVTAQGLEYAEANKIWTEEWEAYLSWIEEQREK